MERSNGKRKAVTLPNLVGNGRGGLSPAKEEHIWAALQERRGSRFSFVIKTGIKRRSLYKVCLYRWFSNCLLG